MPLEKSLHARIKSMIVTNNVREFSRVPGLAVEDWTKSAVP